ncbi:MAG: hypothetical protein H6706_10885 [Myxococcales bacterium]|nr:hypothetical protein [Myxococcales bacterium]
MAEALTLYPWPFNVRELQHVARAAAIEVAPGGRLELAGLPPAVRAAFHAASSQPEESAPLDREGLVALLRTHQGNVAAAARATGASRQQLYRRLEALGIDPASLRDP